MSLSFLLMRTGRGEVELPGRNGVRYHRVWLIGSITKMIGDVIDGRCLFNILGIFSPWILHTNHVSVLRGTFLVILSNVVPQYPPLTAPSGA